MIEFTGKSDDKVQRRPPKLIEFTGKSDDKVQRRLPQ